MYYTLVLFIDQQKVPQNSKKNLRPKKPQTSTATKKRSMPAKDETDAKQVIPNQNFFERTIQKGLKEMRLALKQKNTTEVRH